ncbi:MAG: ZIP family metal transporter [Anaerolineaceae bacterium]|nr:ZIP family metal transporter [Anaerolineaceae bacterium]MBN2677563.1 ZIP family metal transporter [Anaerolineaceae bacterium]
MFFNTFGAVILASSLACIVTTLGIYVISKYEKWGNQNVVYFISFAAGVLISVSFIHIIPKAFEMNGKAPIYLLVGFMGMYLINRFVSMYVCHERECTDLSMGLIPMIGIGLHSFIDGIIYSVTFNVSIFTGTLAAIGMVLHEFPEGIVTFLLLERGGFSRRKSMFLAFIAAALSTPLGTLISFPVISRINRDVLGILLAISAGALVYVGATHLLPAVEKENKKFTLVSLGTGVLVAILIVITKT